MTACQMRLLSFLIVYHFIDSITANTHNCINPNPCNNTVINCSPNEDCLIECHDTNSCANSIINCPTINGKCEIECTNTASCKQTIINSYINNEVHINCDASYSCFATTFNTQTASLLNIEGCQQDQSCLDLSIYCPSHSDDINCVIEGNDNLGSSPQSDGIQIYAINGWNDIEINYNGSFSTQPRGKMYCNKNYTIDCDIALNDWSCSDTKHYCNNPTTTLNPNDNPNDENVITISIDINKLLLPIIFSVVLLICLIAACCVWYKILCKPKSKSKQNPETNTNENMMHDIIGSNNDINANNIHNYNLGVRGSIVPSKSSPAISVVSSAQNTPVIVAQKPYRLSISSLAPPINIQHRKHSASHSSSQHSHNINEQHMHMHYNNNNNNNNERLSTHNYHNNIHRSITFQNPANMMNMEGGLSENEFENDNNSDSELYIQQPQSNNRTPIGTPQGTPEPPPIHHIDMQELHSLNLQEHKTIDIDDDNIIISHMDHKHNNNNGSDSDLYLQPNQSMISKSNVTINGISTIGGTPPSNINKQGQPVIVMDIATDLCVGSVFNK